MLISIKKSFEEGLERIRWFSALISERTRLEIAVMKLMAQSRELEKRKDSLVKTIGERVYELKEKAEINVFKDPKVDAALIELQELDAELLKLKESVSSISRAE